MTQSREPNDRDIYTRVAALEYQLTEIQNTQAQLRATIAPGGYVTDAFERVVEHIDERINESERRIITHVDTRMDEMNSKVDVILRSITGLGNS
jgi:hypothetical protein